MVDKQYPDQKLSNKGKIEFFGDILMKQTKCILLSILIVCCYGILSAQANLVIFGAPVEVDLYYGETGIEDLELFNLGDSPLTYTASRAPGSTFFNINGSTSVSGSVSPGEHTVLRIHIYASGTEGTSYGGIDITSNDPDLPFTRIYVTRRVYNPNHPPVLNLPYMISVPYNGSLGVDFRNFASDPDGDPLAVNVEATGPVSYVSYSLIPAPNWYGETQIRVSVSDGEFVVTDDVLVSVNVPPVLDLPESFSFARNDSLLVNFSPYIIDPDNSISSLSLSFIGNSGISIRQLGPRAVFSAPNGFAGSETITIRLNDGYNLVQGSFQVNVINHAPLLNLPGDFSLDQNGSLTVDFTPFISDPDGDITVLSFSGNSNIGISQEGYVISFNPAYDWFGSEEIFFSISDGYLQASTLVIVTVNQVISLDTPELMISASMNDICISWQPVDYAGEYQVYRASEPNGSYDLVATTGNTMYFETSPQERAFYYVKAVSYP